MKKILKFSGIFLIILCIVYAPLISDAVSILLDEDKDGISDALEKYAGLDPTKDECPPASCNHYGSDYLIIILDQSGSMADTLGNDTRMEVAKRVSVKLVSNLPDNLMGLGFYSYGYSQDCNELKEWQPTFEKLKKKELIDNIQKMGPGNGTPIANSLKKVKESIQDKKGNFHVVLITDGGEGCDNSTTQADVIKEAESLISIKSSTLNVKLDIVGLDVPPEVKADLEKVSQASKGKYTDAKTEEDLEEAFLSPLKDIISNLQGIVCLQKQLDKLLHCEQKRSDKLNIAITKLQSGLGGEFSKEELNAILKNYPKTEKFREEKIEKYTKLKRVNTDQHIKQIRELGDKLTPKFKRKKTKP